MGTTNSIPRESTAAHESLFLASRVLLEVNRIVRGIHVISEMLLRYAAVGTSITDSLIEMVMLSRSEQS